MSFFKNSKKRNFLILVLKIIQFPATLFLAPFALWLGLFWGFLSDRATIVQDTFTFYASVKYFLDNLQLGLYPLWDPSVLWGAPATLNIRPIGEFNPFLLLTLFLNRLGFDFYHAFILYLVTYYFVGVLGFYFLAKELLKDKNMAYLAYLMLMFSSLAMTVLSQVNMLLLFVPVVWFFYFAFRFFRKWERPIFLGMIFSLMIIMTTYLPFYFLTIFSLCIILIAVFYPRRIKEAFVGFRKFFRSQKFVVTIGLVAIVIAFVVPVLSYLEVWKGEIVTPGRHPVDTIAHSSGMKMGYQEMSSGGLSTKMSFQDLFSNLDEVQYENDGFFYLSIFAYIVFCLSIFNRVNKRSVALLLIFLATFFIALAEITPIHRFLYSHVFFFRLFRNTYYFLPFLLSLFILLMCEQLRVLLDKKYEIKNKPWVCAGLVVGIHLAFLVFLIRQGNILWSSYFTWTMSLIFFTSYFLGIFGEKKRVILLTLIILTVLQPITVFFYYNDDALKHYAPVIRQAISEGRIKPRFSFTRPEQDVYRYETAADPNVPNYFFGWARSAMHDFPGFIAYRCGFPTAWYFYIFEYFTEYAYRNYVKNKFLIYDRVEPLNDLAEARSSIVRIFKTNGAVALISREKKGVSLYPNAEVQRRLEQQKQETDARS